MSVMQNFILQAEQKLPPIDNFRNPQDYFNYGSNLLQHASQFKKANDYENTFIYLKAFEILITNRLPQHAGIASYYQEYQYNVEKVEKLQGEINRLLTELSKKYPELRSPPPLMLNPGFEIPPEHIGKKLPTPPVPKKRDSLTLPPPVSNSVVNNKANNNNNVILPPVPTKLANNNNNTKVSTKNNTIEQMSYNAIGSVVNNDKVQTAVGNGVANLAQNDEVQTKVGIGVASASMNKNVQKKLGNMVAESSDNTLVKSLANNEKIQSTVGVAIAKTAGNKEVQKKVGGAIAKAATDKEVQKKVAKGFMSILKGAAKGGKAVGGFAIEQGKNYYEQQNK
ncbi:hypothetical protein ABK040_015028 [Willaertia magna]